jgi:hypothetical protein
MLPQTSLLKDWYEKHYSLGGYVASCYVDWNIIQNPIYDFVELIEKYKKIDYLEIEEFATADVTNNSMSNRLVMEDMSKIKYLTEEIMADSLMFHPQVIHEPWFDRYRIHPGSGRAIALWLCGYTQFKAIYTHFDEPGFEPPGDTIRMDSWRTLSKELGADAPLRAMLQPPDAQTFQAFPSTYEDILHTTDKDDIWAPTFTTTKPWEFLVYSEGQNFLGFKKEWRSHSYDLYTDLQHSITQIGSTIFEFKNDQVIKVIRGDEVYYF